MPFLWLLPAFAKAIGTLLGAVLEVIVKPAAWLLLGVALLAGSIYGGNKARAVCDRDKAASVAAARQVDETAAAQARAAMEQQRQAAEIRASEAEKRVQDYERQIRAKPGCALDAGDVDLFDRVPIGPALPGGQKGTSGSR